MPLPKEELFIKKYDWPVLYKEFCAATRQQPDLMLQEWTAEKSLNYTNTSRQFTKIQKELAASKLSRLAPKAVDKLEELLDAEDEGVQSRVAMGILDRTGHSPQSTLINVNNGNQVLVAPMFAGDYKEEFGNMLDANENEFQSEKVIDEH